MRNKLIGILLVNLGTPNSFKSGDVFRYLNEFLTDRRVIDIPWIQRQCLVRGFIVPTRYRQSSELYQRLWTNEGSPLLVHGKAVQQKLQESLGSQFKVVLAMRYQNPSIEKELEALKKLQIDSLIVLPLFPQYASATTGSVHQKIMEKIKNWEIIPKLTFINSFFDHPAFIDAFCTRAQQYDLSFYDHVIFSFHGLPERQILKADKSSTCLTSTCCQSICQKNAYCYKAQCYATARAIAKQLKINEKDHTVCFQSRLGKDPWIKPYTSDVLKQCATNGNKRLLVFSPSFVCDCLETICEISYEYQEEFIQWGGETLQLVEGLNSHPKWIEGLKNLVMEHMDQPLKVSLCLTH